MIRLKRSILLVPVALAVAVSACQARPAATSQQQLQTVTVTRGSLQATVSAAGTIAAQAQVAVQFQASGQVKTVNVKVGDRVKAGQVMASLDATDLQAAIVSAQAGVDSAQAGLETTQKGPLPSQVRSSQAALTSAQAAYRAAQAKAAHLGDQVTIEQNSLDNAAKALNDAQNTYSNLFEYPRSTVRGRFVPPAGREWSSQKATLDNARVDYEVAVANYNLAVADVNTSGVQQAAAQVAQAAASLDALKNTPAPEDVQLAELSVQSAQLALDQAKLNLQNAQLVAPFDAVVADLAIQPGQQASAGTQAVILVDLSGLEAQVNVSETDLPSVQVGQSAQVTFDALPNETFPAHVVEIAYVGTVTQGVVNYPVTIALDQPDPQIRPGMTANVSIVVQQRDNILVVPSRAIKLVGKQRFVTVLKAGKPEQVEVTLGMSSDTQSEVTSGLNEGDVVAIQQTTTTTRGVPGVGGLGIPGGLGR